MSMYEEKLPNYSIFCQLLNNSNTPSQWEGKNQLRHLSLLYLFLLNNNCQLLSCAGLKGMAVESMTEARPILCHHLPQPNQYSHPPKQG